MLKRGNDLPSNLQELIERKYLDSMEVPV